MPRKSVALFLASTTLLSALVGCSPEREAGEKGGEEVRPGASGQTVQPQTEQKKEEGEGGEGGEGGDGGEG